MPAGDAEGKTVVRGSEASASISGCTAGFDVSAGPFSDMLSSGLDGSCEKEGNEVNNIKTTPKTRTILTKCKCCQVRLGIAETSSV
jgi:hypothetical protein